VRARRATAADWPEVAALRTRVFVEEQGVPAEVEQDEHDATAVHALVEDGTVAWWPPGGCSCATAGR
jgi:predicted GNAT family N-acyltransferase